MTASSRHLQLDLVRPTLVDNPLTLLSTYMTLGAPDHRQHKGSQCRSKMDGLFSHHGTLAATQIEPIAAKTYGAMERSVWSRKYPKRPRDPYPYSFVYD